jgi:hypothetical protein
LPTWKKAYAKEVSFSGEGDLDALRKGRQLTYSLKKAHRAIESGMLLKKLLATSTLFHGAQHVMTSDLKRLLNQQKERYVHFVYNGEPVGYQALRYTDDGKGLVVIYRKEVNVKPITGLSNGTTMTIETDRVIYNHQGTPVICHGLTKAVHLNGELGEIRDFDTKCHRYHVYFHNKNLKPSSARVAHKNLLLVFDLTED